MTDQELFLARTSDLFQTNDTSTPATADGQTVGLWRDVSGNEQHATQSTAENRPTYRARSQHSLAGTATAQMVEALDDLVEAR